MKFTLFTLFSFLSLVALTSAAGTSSDDCGCSDAPADACCDGDKYVIKVLYGKNPGRCISRPAGYVLDYEDVNDSYDWAADLTGDYDYTDSNDCNCDAGSNPNCPS